MPDEAILSIIAFVSTAKTTDASFGTNKASWETGFLHEAKAIITKHMVVNDKNLFFI